MKVFKEGIKVDFELKLTIKSDKYSSDLEVDNCTLDSSDGIADTLDWFDGVNYELDDLSFVINDLSISEISDLREIFKYGKEYKWQDFDYLLDALFEISSIDEDEIVSDHFNHYPDEQIYSMEEFDSKMENMNCTARDAINMVRFGDFRLDDDYFKFDGYSNLKSLTESDYEAIKLDIVKDKVEEILDNYHSRMQNS